MKKTAVALILLFASPSLGADAPDKAMDKYMADETYRLITIYQKISIAQSVRIKSLEEENARLKSELDAAMAKAEQSR